MIKIYCEETEFQLDERVHKLTYYFQQQLAILAGKQDINLKLFKKEDVSRLVNVLKICDYKFEEMGKVDRPDASAYIGTTMNDFFKTLNCNSHFI